MQKIIDNIIGKLNKESTLDEIKNTLKQECETTLFTISKEDWDYLITEILYKLAQ